MIVNNIKHQNINKYVKVLSLLLVIFLFIIPPKHANAATPTTQLTETVPAQSLKVSPIINDLQLQSGKPTSFTLTVQNLSSNPVGIHVTISGYDVTSGASVLDQKPSQMISWTSLSKQDVLIAPYDEKQLTVTITPPAHLPPSGYYETIFLTPIIHQELLPNSPIVLSRVGVLVLGTIGTLDYSALAKKVSVSNFSPNSTLLNNFPKVISFTVNNHYFTHFDAKPFLTITPLFGKPQTILLEDRHVLPNDSRSWQYQPTSHYNIFYRVHLAVSVGDGKQVSADAWFVVLPYKPLLLLIIVFIIVYFATFKRKRLKKFVAILFRG
jgi:hypothetical protein